jgi:putative ABC transport system substrate-binding protein
MQQQTLTIPTVFVYTPDPVGLGFVQSLARPDGNITGFSSYDAPLMGEWLQLLKEIAPNVTRVAVLFDQSNLIAQAASYIDRIPKGANPADLPVQQPLIINLQTANTLGLTVPPDMLDLADEVIE